MNLYLKYRPKTIDELDLKKVREALMRFVASGELAHAYLFTGPRGAGKTSAARILARVVNCERNRNKLAEPCNECFACKAVLAGSALDVIEIDAASNRGIDDIRDLKEKIRLAPISLPYKVYIIDEVHMLTTEAFNALLKTLEEPPKHSIFILCTTELHKVPETIVSRCVQVNFYKATKEELLRSLSRVIEGEGMELAEDILNLVAERVDGSFRDGVKMIEQILLLGEGVNLTQVETSLSSGSLMQAEEWVESMLARDTERSLKIFNDVVGKGADITAFLVTSMQKLRGGLLSIYGIGESKLKIDKEAGVKLVYAIDEIVRKVGNSAIPQLLVEAMIIEWGGGQVVSPPGSQSAGKSDDQSVSLSVGKSDLEGAQLRSLWRKMLASIPKDQYSLESLLAKASPTRVVGKSLFVRVGYDFHKTQLETSKFRSSVEKLVAEVFGMPLIIVYEVLKDDTMGTVVSSDDLIEQAQEIFVN